MTLPTLDVVKTFPTSKDIPPNYGRDSKLPKKEEKSG